MYVGTMARPHWVCRAYCGYDMCALGDLPKMPEMGIPGQHRTAPDATKPSRLY
jgi:hypothetical protein